MERGSTADRNLSVLPVLTQHQAGTIYTAAKVIFRMQICSYHSSLSDLSTASQSFQAKDQYHHLAYRVWGPGPSPTLQPCLTAPSPVIRLQTDWLPLRSPFLLPWGDCCSLCLESSSVHFTELASPNASQFSTQTSLLDGILPWVPATGHNKCVI